MKALELADAYADACFDQALNGRTEDPIPEQKRDELAAELRRLAAVEASILQAILDPENQPSQYGTVTLEKHANKVSDLTDKYCALVDRLSTLKAERDALKEQMRDVAMLLLDNDRSGLKKWATGLVLCESGGEWSVSTVVAEQQKEIDALKAELERIKALPPVAWIRPSGKAMLEAGGNCTVYASEGMSNHSTALYALGSKTDE